MSLSFNSGKQSEMKELEHEFLRGEGMAESEVEGVSEIKDQDEHECGMMLLHVQCHVHL